MYKGKYKSGQLFTDNCYITYWLMYMDSRFIWEQH